MKAFKFIRKPLSAVAASTMLSVLALSTPVQASQFGIRVVNVDGEPVSGASVCVGLPGNYKQFGAMFTDTDGNAVVEVPNVPLVVTISKTRFSGMRLSEPARGFNLIRQVTLAEGTPGPRCRAGTTLAANPPSIRIGNVGISENSNRTTLIPTVSGEPSHYRVGSSPEFLEDDWKRFDDAIALSATLADASAVFLQMRRFEGTSDAGIEARSDVVEVPLTSIR